MSERQQLVSVPEAAKALGVSPQRIHELLRAGRIVGAQRVGRYWVIPAPVKVLAPQRGRRQNNAASAPKGELEK